MTSNARVVVYPNVERIFRESISGTMTFGELKRRCIELSKALRLRRAIFIIEYKAKYSLMYTVRLEGNSGLIKRRSVSLVSENVFLNPEWSFDDRIRSYDKVVANIDAQVKVLNLPLFHNVSIVVMHNGCPREDEKTLAGFCGE